MTKYGWNIRCVDRRRRFSGAVLANRLSEDGTYRIMLLEAGLAYSPNLYPPDLVNADITGGPGALCGVAAGVTQFALSVRLPHIVESEDSGDRHFQLTPCDEVCPGDHGGGRGLRVACQLDPEPLHGFEIGDGIDPVRRDF